MKSLNEASSILINTIKEYQLLCINSKCNKLISDTTAFFNNLVFKKHYCGQTGYQRSINLLTDIQIEINNHSIISTEQLIKFTKKYYSGPKLKKYINKAIREIAEFHHGHIDYLIMIYQQSTGDHNKEKTRKIIEALIDAVIEGEYQSDLYKNIGDYIGLQKVHQADYGARLLACLENMVPSLIHLNNFDNNNYRI